MPVLARRPPGLRLEAGADQYCARARPSPLLSQTERGSENTEGARGTGSNRNTETCRQGAGEQGSHGDKGRGEAGDSSTEHSENWSDL